MSSRRNFLQKLTASFIAIPFLSNDSLASIDKNVDQIFYDGPVLRVAIMGLGSYGTRVADAIQACTKVKLVGAISGTPSKLTAWKTKYNIPEKNCYNYENFDDIKNNPDIDAVYIITPNALHKEQTIRVAQAGKHVICEKPMALNGKEGEQMIAACKKTNVKHWRSSA
jgi:predicted dehydrogenase